MGIPPHGASVTIAACYGAVTYSFLVIGIVDGNPPKGGDAEDPYVVQVFTVLGRTAIHCYLR